MVLCIVGCLAALDAPTLMQKYKITPDTSKSPLGGRGTKSLLDKNHCSNVLGGGNPNFCVCEMDTTTKYPKLPPSPCVQLELPTVVHNKDPNTAAVL